MRVLYIHQYFCTRAGRSGTRSYEFARHLLRAGHQVTMLTSDSDLSDIRIEDGQSSLRCNIEGIDVLAVHVPYSQKLRTLGRIRSFLQFMWRSSWIALRLPRHDVIVATSTPLTVGVPGLLAAAVRRTPLVFEVRDLWPEAPIQMGVIGHPVLIGVLRAFERLVYRRSAHVIALSPGMRDGIEAAGTPTAKISVIPNCSDLDLFRPGPAPREVVERLGLEGRFVVAYAGSMGEANAMDVLIDAAARLQDTPNVRFVLIGHGKQADLLREDVARHGLTNVVFAGSVPRNDVVSLLQASHVALVLFKDLPVLATNSPNKLFDALAAGLPVVVNSDGWTRRLVEENAVGRFAQPGSGASLASQILWLHRHPEERSEMGVQARRLAEQRFDRLRLAAEFEEVLLAASERRRPDRVAAVWRPSTAAPATPPSESTAPELETVGGP